MRRPWNTMFHMAKQTLTERAAQSAEKARKAEEAAMAAVEPWDRQSWREMAAQHRDEARMLECGIDPLAYGTRRRAA